jgi:hypothetical protein
MPRAKSPTQPIAKTDDSLDPFLYRSNTHQPKPEYTSFIARNAALVAAKLSGTQLQTDKDGRSTDLKKPDNKELIAILGPDFSDQFKSPYDAVDLIRFHEVLRDDGIASAALDFLIQFMLGDHFKTIIDINAEFDTEEEESAARDFFVNNPRIRAYKRRLDRVNREVKFQIHMFSLLLQCFAFGRACGLIEKSDIDNLPIAIKVLPSMHLGQVFVHRKTWEIIGVEHLDWPFPASIIKTENMIYFANRNHNISPSTFQYGYSLIERVVDLSELNRITNQRNLKEINFRLWAAFLLIKLPGSYNKDVMQKMADEISNGAGNSIFTNQAATVEVHQLGHDMDKLLDQRDKNYREIIRQLQVPIILFDPDILNRATSQELMEAWTVSVLKIYRSWFKDIVQDQWINPILKTLIEDERQAAREQETTLTESPIPQESEPKAKGLDQEKEKEEAENANAPSKQVKETTKEVIPIDAIDPATGEVLVYRLPWKIKLELDPLNYDTYKERAETAILLKNNGLMTIGTALKSIGVTDENELAQLLEMEEERRLQNQQFQGAQVAAEQGQKTQKTGQPITQQQQQQGGPGGPKPRTLDRQKEKFREELRSSVTGQNVPTKTGIRPKRGVPTKRGF